jgi:quercetin dioxygenase-like cupin family protein/HD superfamily phosphodiesterase
MNDSRKQLLSEMEKYFGSDRKRINHAVNVLEFADEINRFEDGDERVVTAAAILHDIGIKNAEKKYDSSAGNYQEIEGPPVAEDILLKNGFDVEETRHICKIIANHHSAKDIDTGEFRIIWDADRIVNIPDEIQIENPKKLKEFIEKTFKTESGKRIAFDLHSKKGGLTMKSKEAPLKPASIDSLVEYSGDSIVSKTLVKKKGGTVTAFAFAAGQALSEHSAPFDAMVQVIDGGGVFTVGGNVYNVKAGELLVMPANVPHSVKAEKRFKMLLTMITN